MARMIRVLAAAGILAALTMPVARAQSVRAQFSVAGTLMFGQDDDGELSGIAGATVRLDLDLGRSFMVSPEALLTTNWHLVLPAFTLNIKFGSIYAGAGPMIWQGRWLLKAHVGTKPAHWLIEAVYVRGGIDRPYGARPTFIGMSLGYAF